MKPVFYVLHLNNHITIQANNLYVIFQFQTLLGRSNCAYNIVLGGDTNLLNKQTVEKCVQILSSLRLVMQAAAPDEYFSWVLFNGKLSGI